MNGALDNKFEEFIAQLRRLERHRRRSELLLWAPRGLLAGLMVVVILAVYARFRPILLNQELAFLAVLLGTSGFFASALIVLVRRQTLLEKARYADRHFGLLERATAAIEIENGQITTAKTFVELQLADTTRALAAVDEKRDLPLRPNWRDLAMIALTAALLVIAMVMPNRAADLLVEQRAIEKAIDEQVLALEALEESVQLDESLADSQISMLTEPVQGAIDELRVIEPTREQAVAALSDAANELRELSSATDHGSLQQALRDASEPLIENEASQKIGQALQQGNLFDANSALTSLADGLTGLNEIALHNLASDLTAAASNLRSVDPVLASEFDQIAQSLREGDIAAAQQALRESAASVQEIAQDQTLSRRATAMAEQLDQGRQHVAQATRAGQQAPVQGQGQGGGGAGTGQGTGPGDGLGFGQGQGNMTDLGDGAGGPGPGGGHSENVYLPDFVDLSTETGIAVGLPAQCRNDPEKCGFLLTETATGFGEEQSLVPYDQVFADYRNAAYEALEGEHIPLSMKSYVRDYFTSLEP